MEPLKYLIDHVFLPPRLPQMDDSHVGFDLEALKDALTSFKLSLPPDEQPRWATIIKMVNILPANKVDDSLVKMNIKG